MTLEEVKTEMLLRTELYIEEMKGRRIELPTQRRAFSRLYDQITEEIFNFGIQQVPQIIDINHLRYDMSTVIAFVRPDLWLLTARVPEIILATAGKIPGTSYQKRHVFGGFFRKVSDIIRRYLRWF